MLNEANYNRQMRHFEQLHYMRTAFAGVMAGKGDSHKVKSSEKRLKPKRNWSYDTAKDEDVRNNVDGMENYFKQTGKIKKEEITN